MSVAGGTAHPDELLPAYALDALAAAERAAVDEHLGGCARCRAELRAFREAASELAGAVAAPPPPQLWDRVRAELGPQETAPARARPTRPPARRPALGVLAAAAAALAVVAAGTFALGRATSGDDPAGLPELVEAAMAGDGAQVLTLAGDDGAALARVVVGGGEGGSFVLLDGLDRLPGGDTYQLWSLDGPEPVSLGLLGDGSARVVAVPVPPDVRHLAVSHEAAGGAASPTLPPVASA